MLSRFRVILILPALLLAAVSRPCVAQDRAPLVTDRPDFTESTVAVPVGTLQLETGITAARDHGQWALSGAEALLRWAPDERMELRLLLPDYTISEDLDGFGDVGIGLKAELGAVGGWEAALLAGTTLPTGRRGMTADRLVPGVMLVAGRPLDEVWSLGAQIGADWPTGDVADPDLAGTLVLSRPVSGRITSFVELRAGAPVGEEMNVLFHHGYVFGSGDFAQLDVHIALGLTGPAPGVMIGCGWSRRF